MDEKEVLVELKEVSKSFGGRLILDKIDLKVYAGDSLVIIGPSGCGKSTVLKLIAGLIEPDEGEIYVKGKKRVGLIEDSNDPFNISMVFQQAALFDSLSVRENVGFSLYQHSNLPLAKIEEIVAESLEKVGLSAETANLHPAQLSGGMRKRVSFARAVVFNPEKPEECPEVILYDEPTAGLDPIASTVVEDLVKKLKTSFSPTSAYVMVTHQNSTIRRTGDRVVFLYDGKVQWEGKVDEIDQTDNPLVRQFFSASTQGPIK